MWILPTKKRSSEKGLQAPYESSVIWLSKKANAILGSIERDAMSRMREVMILLHSLLFLHDWSIGGGVESAAS